MILKFKDFLRSCAISESEYVVQKGDTLSAISTKLGIENWKSLYNLNKDTIGKNPSSIRVGMKLKTPGDKAGKVEPVEDLFSDTLVDGKVQGKKYADVITDIKPKAKYLNWEDLKKQKNTVNAMSPSEIIKAFHKDSEAMYLILDKNKGKMELYKGSKGIMTLKVGTGENPGDEQTRTVVRDGKVYWEEGNKMTGAGIYTVSGIDPKNKHYSNAPSWNFKNEGGIEIPMAIHSSFGDRIEKLNDEDPKNNRLSNGCINCIASDLKSLYKSGFGESGILYILPDDSTNKFEISNGRIIFKSKDPNVNRSTHTLNYIPIKIVIDESKFRSEVFQWNDFNDEKEYTSTTKPFVKALQDNKRKVMIAAGINGDVYNDIARIAFGIYGTESNFGDTHSGVGNLVRAGKKFFSPSSSSSPDYMSKATTYGANKDSNSVGLTQIRFNMLDQSEKSILAKLGITSNQQLLKPEGSALATLGILAARYTNQLNAEEKKDPMANLPKKWNVRANYPERVKTNSKYITIKQLG
jgi:LysM repeat protein